MHLLLISLFQWLTDSKYNIYIYGYSVPLYCNSICTCTSTSYFVFICTNINVTSRKRTLPLCHADFTNATLKLAFIFEYSATCDSSGGKDKGSDNRLLTSTSDI